ncbi:MAG: hypothetical protein ACO3B3_08050 [Cyanobium sp.]
MAECRLSLSLDARRLDHAAPPSTQPSRAAIIDPIPLAQPR